MKTIEAANRFLVRYLLVYNQRFGVRPVSEANLHRPASCDRDLAGILCLKTERALRHDRTVMYHRRLYQVEARTG